MSHPTPEVAAGRENAPFPETLWTAVLEASGPSSPRSAEALAKLAGHYRPAIHRWFLQSGAAADVAEDLAHDFLLELVKGCVLERFQRSPSRFRSFLAVCLRNYLRDYRRRESAQKRGGGMPPEALDPETPDARGDAAAPRLDLDFALTAHDRALATVRADWETRGLGGRFAALLPFVCATPAAGQYEVVGRELNLKTGAVKKAVFDLREAYYEMLRREVAQTTRPEGLEDELRYLITLLSRVV